MLLVLVTGVSLACLVVQPYRPRYKTLVREWLSGMCLRYFEVFLKVSDVHSKLYRVELLGNDL